MNPKGNTLLKVSGILLIIFGAISVVAGLLALVGAIAAMAIGSDPSFEGGVLLVTGILVFAGVLTLLQGLLDLISGILGVKNCTKPNKASTCFAWGIIMIIVQIISLIFNASGATDATWIITGIIGLVLPVLYLIGATQLKRGLPAVQQPIPYAAAPQQPTYAAPAAPVAPAAPAAPEKETVPPSTQPPQA